MLQRHDKNVECDQNDYSPEKELTLDQLPANNPEKICFKKLMIKSCLPNSQNDSKTSETFQF